MSLTTATYILIVAFTAGGMLSVCAALLNWDWFFRSESVRMLTYKLRRPYARILYGLLGMAILAMSAYMFVSIR